MTTEDLIRQSHEWAENQHCGPTASSLLTLLCTRLAEANEELAETKKLLDPVVIAAAKRSQEFEDLHPAGCCGQCSRGLFERDRYREALRSMTVRPIYDSGNVQPFCQFCSEIDCDPDCAAVIARAALEAK